MTSNKSKGQTLYTNEDRPLKILVPYCISAALAMFCMREYPLIAILLTDLIICALMVNLFKSAKYKWILLTYPFIILTIINSINGDWFLSGDGYAHTPAAEQIETDGLYQAIDIIQTSNETNSIFIIAKKLSIGASIGYLLNFSYFQIQATEANQGTFIASQGFIFLIIVAIIAILIIEWRVLDHKAAFVFISFLILSPTTLEFNSVPNRHLVTLGGLSLLCVSHMALKIKYTNVKLIVYLISLGIIVVSKAPLLVTYIIFCMLTTKINFIKRYWAFILSLIIVSYIIVPSLFSYLYDIVGNYDDQRVSGMSKFDSSIISTPVIGWAIKYVYAILSPFPWTKVELYIDNNYTGSYLLFFFHVLSSLTGIYFVSVIILKWSELKILLNENERCKHFVKFGMIMSVSIIGGATGFHGYLSIYFPFLSVLFIYKAIRVSIIIPFTIATLAELGAILIR